MSEGYDEDRRASLTHMSAKKMLIVFALGAGVGLVIWGLSMLLDTYVLKAVLCQGSQSTKCVTGSLRYAEAAAAIIGAGTGLYFLVRFDVFRPLLVALAAIISLWGIVETTSPLPWFETGLATILLYAFAYALFAWIARIRLFSTTILIFIVLVVAIRYSLSL